LYVCLCNGVTERQVRAQAGCGAPTVSDVHRALGSTPKCGKCIPMMRRIVREATAETAQAAA
jgi:bacterioferritin-associated ferredoxin